MLGTGQTPVASPSCIVPVYMALLNTVTEDRVQTREGLLRFLVQTLLALLGLILFLFLFLLMLFYLVFHPLFFLLSLLRFFFALFDSHLLLLVFVIFPSFQQHDSPMVLGSLMFFFSFLFLFLSSRKTIYILCGRFKRSSHGKMLYLVCIQLQTPLHPIHKLINVAR